MATKKTKVNMPGVAAGKELAGIPTGEDVSPEERVKVFLFGSLSEEFFNGWGADLIHSSLKLHSATTTPSRVTFHYTVAPSHCNRLGNLHGGCTSTLFDICTTAALAPIARPGFWMFAGVTRTLNVTYLRPVPEGEKVLIECEVVHAGKRLCSIKGEMRREGDGAVLATCEHGKVSIDPEVGRL